jgi:hypothetical protein
MSKFDFGLGRIYAPDERDKNFPLRAMLTKEAATKPPKPHKYWLGRQWLNQGETSSCTGHAAAHWAYSSPITYKLGALTQLDPYMLYREAQKVDEWAGEDYDGSSVRAVMKVMQALGFVESYSWGHTLEDALLALEMAPIVVGINWYTGMFSPNSLGLIRPSGDIEGGHAVLVDGYTRNEKRIFGQKRRQVRLHNSWGREWGHNGYAYMDFDHFAQLIAEQGEICLAKEKKFITPKI